MNGKERLYSIGIYANISLVQARKCKDAARASVAAGIASSEAKQEEKRVRKEAKRQTFETIGAAFLAKQHKLGEFMATLDKTEYHLRLANRDFGRKPISEITAPIILKTLRKVEAKGNYETAIASVPALAQFFALQLLVALPRVTQLTHRGMHLFVRSASIELQSLIPRRWAAFW
ncbi:MAG: hypothetical protein AAFQ32_00390 [Pseudomonadota bacterium]